MPEAATTDSKEIHKLFRLMRRYGASDLHLKAGAPPVFRIRGDLRNLDLPPLSDAQVRRLVYEILSEDQIRTLERVGDVDLGYSVDEHTRVRINTYHQRGCLSLAARLVNFRVPTFQELHLPTATMEQVASLDQGFVIISGTYPPRRSGRASDCRGSDCSTSSCCQFINWLDLQRAVNAAGSGNAWPRWERSSPVQLSPGSGEGQST